jgi:hypothetical protein
VRARPVWDGAASKASPWGLWIEPVAVTDKRTRKRNATREMIGELKRRFIKFTFQIFMEFFKTYKHFPPVHWM